MEKTHETIIWNGVVVLVVLQETRVQFHDGCIKNTENTEFVEKTLQVNILP